MVDFSTKVQGLNFSSPFQYQNRAVPGNPIPYTSLGMDNSFTFAYKMYEQRKAIEWYKSKVTADIRDYFSDERTTLALGNDRIENFMNSYVNEIEVFKVSDDVSIRTNSSGITYRNYPDNIQPEHNGEMIKPFLPGYFFDGPQGVEIENESPYNPDKIAGVDALGLLTGAISSAGLKEKIISFRNYTPLINADNYYNFTYGSSSGRPSGQ